MPAWTTHLKIARELSKKLKIEDEESFIFGNIMPDVLSGYILKNPSIKVDSAISHFRSDIPPHHIDFDVFLQKYKSKFSNPVVLGYYTHLLTDYFWNNWVYSKDYEKSNLPAEIFRRRKHLDFTNFEKYLQANYDLGNPIVYDSKTLNFASEIQEVPCNEEDITRTVDFLNEIITDKKEYENKYLLFSEKELVQLLEETYKFILEKINI